MFQHRVALYGATKLTNTPRIASARHELVRKDLAAHMAHICHDGGHACWICVRSTLDGRWRHALSAGIFEDCSSRKAQSHIVDTWPTHWNLIIFCQSVCRASFARQHSLLVHGGRSTNARGSRGQGSAENATRLPCAAWALVAGAGHTPAARPALEQQAVTMLFLQLNP